MAFVFNADEVFEMAEQIERNGAAFYRRAARQFSEQQGLLQTLAEQEDRHEETFAALRRQLVSAAAREETAYDPDQQAAAYLRAMAGGHVVDLRRKPADLLTGRESLGEMLGIAIGLEKDSIAFYLGLKEMVPPALGREALDAILREEQKHIVFLHALFEDQCPAAG